MSSILVLTLVLITGCFFKISSALTITRDGFYDTKYNHLDIERVLNNKRLVTYYAQCLLGEGPCTPQGTEFKRILPEALHTNCIRCTDKQKVTAYLAIRRLKKEYPKIWQKLQANWDPKGEHVSRFINHVETHSTLQGIKPAETEIPKEQVVEDTIETNSTLQGVKPETEIPKEQVVEDTITSSSNNQSEIINNTVNVLNRFGDDNNDNNDNEISSSVATNSQSPPPYSLIQKVEENIPVTISRPTNIVVINTRRTTPQPIIIYRQPIRPTRYNVLVRPVDLSRLTANVFESIADVGTKVIRTGARIADMVISGVQASVRPLLVVNNNNNKN